MGREVEKSMLYCIVMELTKLGAENITATYIPTERNGPTLDVLANMQLVHNEAYRFEIPLDAEYFKPQYTDVIFE